MSELKNQSRAVIDAAATKPVHLLRDGVHVGTVISPEAAAFLAEALEDRYVSDIARDRLMAIRSGQEELIPDAEFWAQADTIMARRK